MAKQYLDLVRHILDNGVEADDRTGVGTISTFGYQMRFNLQEGFPLLTTKKVPFKSIISELLWFLRGDNNIRYLVEHKNPIWNDNGFDNYLKRLREEGFEDVLYRDADDNEFSMGIEDLLKDTNKRLMTDPEFEKHYRALQKQYIEDVRTNDEFAEEYGSLGPVYGYQWRHWQKEDGEVDQVAKLIEGLKENPSSRRHIISAWNPAEIDKMALPPCHTLVQFYVAQGRLSAQLYQRSADTMLGVPFNIASYSLMIHIIAREVGLEVGDFVHTLGDAHIYKNHIEGAKIQLEREPYKFPQLVFAKEAEGLSFEELEPEMISVENYQHHPFILFDMAI
ncbi:MAG: thymidylate synthase [Tissierellia bacterium]|nr:thymidylate synthase [Tissierellia bacterium]